MHDVVLAGPWEFRFEDEAAWRPIAVPGCWEQLGCSKARSGPALYRTRFTPPADWGGRRIWLCFGGVSYDCVVLVDGREVGRHRGIWDAFRLELTDVVEPGNAAELVVRVEKPASLEGGPASPPVSGSFPLKETLAGFLPYVWGHSFGGIWQDVTLAASGPITCDDVHITGMPDGAIELTAELSAPAALDLQIRDGAGRVVLAEQLPAAATHRFAGSIAEPKAWSPQRPALYTLELAIAGEVVHRRRFGLRRLDIAGTTIRLNGAPIYPRLALSWGWYPEALDSNPGPERVRADLERLKQLGYNGVKLCLWFPPQYYFDLADELGMLLWVELPMWLPDPTPRFREQTPLEYERLVRLARPHPAVILYSLGCELNRAIGADLLGPLYAMVKALAGDALVRDNSGSGEAYGGLLNEYADYYDYHFYSDLQFFRNLIDYFTPRWRPERPWVFGEFCDLDTFRDLEALYAANGGERPWWTLADPELNPQGARWQFDIVEQEARLRANGWWERGAELERISRCQALLHRKWTLEMVRSYAEIGGYVVTGEADTPISTAGMWDDQGALKWPAEEFRAFNQDAALLVGWDKRRTWTGGGDRAGYWDPWCYVAGALVRPHLVLSHYGAPCTSAEVTWSVRLAADAAPFAAGTVAPPRAPEPGSVRELGVAEFLAPDVRAPQPALLEVAAQLGAERTANSWPLWFFPRDAWRDTTVALDDPAGRLRDLGSLGATVVAGPVAGTVLVATAWTPAVAAFVAHGGAAVLVQPGAGPAGPLPTVELPFWREAVRVAERHPAWGNFPHDDMPGLQFFGCATDHALDLTAAGDSAQAILSRLDARTMAVHAYAAELRHGQGRVIVTTLRLEGGQGEQPAGISRSPAAAYLLCCWVRYLAESGR